jgi:hypothetical protein
MPEEPEEPARPRVGVALSGGGHRATMWGIGVLMYLVDAGRHTDVVAISSVSGGSIANGAVAHEVDLATTDPQEFRRRLRPLVRHVADEGLFFFGPATNGYVRRVLLLVAVLLVMCLLLLGLGLGFAIGVVWPPARPGGLVPWHLGVALALAGIGLAVSFARVGTKDRVAPDRLLVGLLAALGLVGAGLVVARIAGVGPDLVVGAADAAGGLVIGVVVAAIGCLWLFERRSEAADRALARVHFGGDTPTDLAAVPSRSVTHVLCATELQSGDHAYFAPRFVYSYRHGLADPPVPGLRLSTAVQASACLPGAFVPRRLDVSGWGLDRSHLRGADAIPPAPPTHMVLTDGGVYDNMADQWFQGYPARTARLPRLSALAHAPVDVLLVANASAGWRWRPMPASPLRSLREVAGLTRAKSIMYDATTSHRRYGLVAQFEAAAAGGTGMRGALVHIPQSPFRVARAFAGDDDEGRRRRAAEVLAHLGEGAEDDWGAIARANTEVETVLRALGPATTARLLRHAYTLAMCNAHVLFGWGLLPVPSQQELESWVTAAR